MLQVEYDLMRMAKKLKQETFDLSGGQQMYEFKFKNETNDEEKKSTKQNLIDLIKGVEKTFEMTPKPTKPEDITLSRRELKEINQNKIKDEATDSLKSYLTDGLNKINDEYNTNRNKLDNELATSQMEGEERLKNLANSYEGKEQKAIDSAINRGMSRGSVIDEAVESINESKAEDLQVAKSEIDNKINSLNSQKELLETKKKNALEAFDIAYAVKLNEKIGKINEDLVTYNQKAQEFNDAQEKKEKEFNLKNEAEYQKNVDRIMDRNQQLIDFIAKQGRDGLESRMALKKSEIALDYLEGMKLADAFTMLVSDDELANALGDTAFQAVLKTITKRLKANSDYGI